MSALVQDLVNQLRVVNDNSFKNKHSDQVTLVFSRLTSQVGGRYES